MRKLLTLLFVFLAISVQATDINGLAIREGLSLNDVWKVIVDPYENGYYNYRWKPFDTETNPSRNAYFMDSKAESPSDLIEYDFDKSLSLNVPGDWNTQLPELFYYEGTIWYRNKFSFEPKGNEKTFVYFDAVNYKAEVYLNGKKLGSHIGGFTPFYFETTGKLNNGENSLVVKVDNKRLREGVPTLNTDWWNYGGITRKVRIISVPQTFISDFSVNLDKVEPNLIKGYVQLSEKVSGIEIEIAVPELKKNLKLQTGENGRAVFSFAVKKIEPWSPENPKIYDFTVSTPSDRIADKIGFRTITTEGKKVLLNGNPVFLRGISVHEEYAADGGGRVKSAAEAKQLLVWAKELNCNFVRLAHYPHNEEIIRLADSLGLLVWAEVPVYWTIDWTNESTYQNAWNQLSELINRDKNRASVIIWSVANETPVSPQRTEFLGKLITSARNLDNSRLLSAAMERHDKPGNQNISVVEDPLADLVDLVSFNQYTGWYGTTPERCAEVTWEVPYNKPVFISEFGGGAKQGFHGDKNQRFTEEYQVYLYEETLKMISKIDGLCGLSPWILVDFRSPRRVLPGIQDNFNRKGLISDKGVKKQAFYTLQNYYKTKQ